MIQQQKDCKHYNNIHQSHDPTQNIKPTNFCKTLAGAVNNVMAPNISKHADDQAEGFIKGRHGVNNLVTIDCHARALDAIAASNRVTQTALLPLLLLFDFAAAFPSLAHAFIFVILEALEVPRGMLLFFRALYSSNRCYAFLGASSISSTRSEAGFCRAALLVVPSSFWPLTHC